MVHDTDMILISKKYRFAHAKKKISNMKRAIILALERGLHEYRTIQITDLLFRSSRFILAWAGNPFSGLNKLAILSER